MRRPSPATVMAFLALCSQWAASPMPRTGTAAKSTQIKACYSKKTGEPPRTSREKPAAGREARQVEQERRARPVDGARGRGRHRRAGLTGPQGLPGARTEAARSSDRARWDDPLRRVDHGGQAGAGRDPGTTVLRSSWTKSKRQHVPEDPPRRVSVGTKLVGGGGGTNEAIGCPSTRPVALSHNGPSIGNDWACARVRDDRPSATGAWQVFAYAICIP